MNKSKIEWCDYTINPVKGLCPMHCKNQYGGEYCYSAKPKGGLYTRFKWNPEIRFDPDTFQPLVKVDKPSRVFVGSTMELFGDWVKHEWMMDIFSLCNAFKRHTFIFLTKQPQNLIRWSPFPENCWVGASTTGFDSRSGLEDIFASLQAKIRFVSIEPLLDYSPMDFRWVDWVIIGQQTPVSQKTEPKIEWIQDILVAAHNAGDIPVFIKNNLRPLIEKEWPGWKILQEFPKGGKKNEG